ncbi:MAG: alpha/beta hydrolase [Rhodobacteraceae bacterium]|nr:alpha/beta hydrolase [Paracoccaceae bacterium]
MTNNPQAVAVRNIGEGPRRVLALHCTLAHSGAWRGLAGRLSDTAFIAPDMLSHGRSPDWDGVGDFQDRSTAAVAHLLEPGMDLIGHSFGATVALRLAVAQPDRVRSLTLIEPVFFAVAVQDAPDLLAQHDADAGPFAEALRAGDAALGARLFNRMWSNGGPRWPELPEVLRAAMTRAIHVVPACRDAIYDDLAGMLLPGVLDRLQIPCLLLRGSETHAVIGAVNDGLARRLPDAENVVIEGAGHMLPVSHPGEAAVALKTLFARSPIL